MKKWFLHKPVVFSSKASSQWQESFTLFTSTVSHRLVFLHVRELMLIPILSFSSHTRLFRTSLSTALPFTLSVAQPTLFSPPHHQTAPLSPLQLTLLISSPFCFAQASRRHWQVISGQISSAYLVSCRH